MEIRVRETGQVMYEGEWRDYIKATKGIRIRVINNEILNEHGADPVFEGAQPSGGTVYQFSMRQGIEQLSDGNWYTKYVLGPIFQDYTKEDGTVVTAAEQEAAYKAAKDAEQAKAVRSNRDSLLKDTDWIVIKCLERNENIPGAWEVYRQALRDVPTQAGFPWNVTWPVQP